MIIPAVVITAFLVSRKGELFLEKTLTNINTVPENIS